MLVILPFTMVLAEWVLVESKPISLTFKPLNMVQVYILVLLVVNMTTLIIRLCMVPDIGYHFFLRGIGNPGFNFGFSLVAGNEKEGVGLGGIFQTGYQF